MKRFILFFLAFFLFLYTKQAHSYSWCSEPDEPYCLSSYSGFSDEDEFSRCKLEVLSYIEELKEYAECIVEDAQEKTDEAIDSFNRRVNAIY